MWASRVGRAIVKRVILRAPQQQHRVVYRRAKFSNQASSKPQVVTKAAKKSLLEECQVDQGFWLGVGSAGAVVAYVKLVPHDTQVAQLRRLVAWMRAVGGISADTLTDTQLLEDFLKRNLVAALNVTLASPAFYFMWHLIHGTPVHFTLVRSLTGTARIIPFMTFFYAILGVGGAMLTNYFMKTGNDYEAAKGNANTVFLLCGLVVLEAIVEMRGCGVPFSSMPPVAFVLFVPTLIGRLAAGVLVQQQKVGEDKVRLLPDKWATEGSEMQQKIIKWTDAVALDRAFVITVVGTSFFQHVLNGITYVLLNKGGKGVVGNVGRYLGGGLTGTFGGALNLFFRTFMMRFFFCLTWNWCSSTDLHVFDFIMDAVDDDSNKPAPPAAAVAAVEDVKDAVVA